MPITFHCPSCGKELSAPDSAAGAPGVCRFCGASLIAPTAEGEPATLADLTPPPPPGEPVPPIPPAEPFPPTEPAAPSGDVFSTDAPPPPPPPYNPPPYVPPGNYAGANYGTPYTGATRTSSLAIGSLVAGILGLCCCIGSIIGLVLGFMAKKEIQESNGTIEGEGLATAGIIISAITLILSVIGMALYPMMMRSMPGGPSF